MPSPPDDLFNYEAMAQEAMRGVVRSALRKAAASGLTGDHHFWITFKTGAEGVSGPPEVLSRYPDEMTIVLQHEFWDLAPGETFFSVTLRFGGQPKTLSIPYSAITLFRDPAVQFGLQFEVSAPPYVVLPPSVASPASAASQTAGGKPGDGEGPKVVSLDQFRKK
jgi:hypothetical protein